MKLFTRRRYKAWLSTLEKKTLTREEIDQILRGQLMLPAKQRDVELMRECAAALDELEGAAHPQKAATWNRIAAGVSQMESSPRRFIKRRVVLITVLLALALAALGVAAAFSHSVFSFLWGQDDPNSYVQENAAGLLKTNLPSISREHVEIIIREAAYDGKELRVVYSVRDKNATRLYNTYHNQEDAQALAKVLEMDGLGGICDWVVVNGKDLNLSDAGELTGDRPGEVFYYIQSLLADQDVSPKGDFTVGLPLGRSIDPATGWPRSYVLPELEFTLNAEEAMKLLRTAAPAETTVEGIRIEITEATFSPVTGALYLRLTGPDKDKLDKAAYDWWGRAQLYTPEGVQMGICSPEYRDDNNWQEGILIKIDVVPPEAWPEEMILSIPDESGRPGPNGQIAVKLQ